MTLRNHALLTSPTPIASFIYSWFLQTLRRRMEDHPGTQTNCIKQGGFFFQSLELASSPRSRLAARLWLVQGDHLPSLPGLPTQRSTTNNGLLTACRLVPVYSKRAYMPMTTERQGSIEAGKSTTLFPNHDAARSNTTCCCCCCLTFALPPSLSHVPCSSLPSEKKDGRHGTKGHQPAEPAYPINHIQISPKGSIFFNRAPSCPFCLLV